MVKIADSTAFANCDFSDSVELPVVLVRPGEVVSSYTIGETDRESILYFTTTVGAVCAAPGNLMKLKVNVSS